MNSPSRKDMNVSEFILMPLLTLSCADCGITDPGFENFIKKIDEI